MVSTLGVRVRDGVEHRAPLVSRYLGPVAQTLGRPGECFLSAQVGRLSVNGACYVATGDLVLTGARTSGVRPT
jgi:hypothetical protein